MIKADSKSLKGVKFIDLFCGIGGFHLALDSFGAKCVFSSDIDERARNVYERNFGIAPSGDITRIGVDEIPKHEILCAGFPCQPFSISGKQSGFKDPRGKLFFQIIRIAHSKQPKVILLENVKNLENHNAGKTINKMKRELRRIGYEPYLQVLNASDFSIPQARKRLYIVAIRNDLNYKEFIFPKGNQEIISLESVLCSGDEYKEEIENSIVKRDAIYNEIIEEQTNGLLRIGKVGLGRQGERIYSIKGHAITLSSQGGGLAGKTGMYLIDNNVRKLLPRECARIMGFPDDYEMNENMHTNYCLFGNSIVVDVVQHVVEELVKYIKEGKKNGKEY